MKTNQAIKPDSKTLETVRKLNFKNDFGRSRESQFYDDSSLTWEIPHGEKPSQNVGFNPTIKRVRFYIGTGVASVNHLNCICIRADGTLG